MIQKISDTISIVFTEDGFLHCNGIVVRDDVNLMIDSAVGGLLAEVDPGSINLLVNSHHHLDHISANPFFPPTTTIAAHPLERGAMELPSKVTATEGWDDLMGDDGLPGQLTEGLQDQCSKQWGATRDLQDNQVIDCGHTDVVVLHTPGHTEGHCSFYFPDQELAFVGDICLTDAGPWYGDLDASMDDFSRSIDRIIELRPKKLTTGHIQEIITENIEERLVSYRNRIAERDRRIVEFLRDREADIHEIAAAHLIYRLHPSSMVLFWEKVMLQRHVARLIEQGLAEEVEEGRYAAVARGGGRPGGER